MFTITVWLLHPLLQNVKTRVFRFTSHKNGRSPDFLLVSTTSFSIQHPTHAQGLDMRQGSQTGTNILLANIWAEDSGPGFFTEPSHWWRMPMGFLHFWMYYSFTVTHCLSEQYLVSEGYCWWFVNKDEYYELTEWEIQSEVWATRWYMPGCPLFAQE